MHKRTRMILIITGIAAATVVIISILLATMASSTKTSAGKQIINAAQIYTDAVGAFVPDPTQYRISAEKETVIGNEVFNESVKQIVTYGCIDTQPFRGIVNETYTVGNHSVCVIEQFDNGNLFITLDDGLFYSEMTEQEYTLRYAPAFLITPELYSSISGVETEESYTLTFTAADELEAWVNEEDSVFISAVGTAEITKDGQLIRSAYDASYTRNDLFIRISVTTEILPQPEDIPEPENKSNFIHISQPDTPKLLERACGQLLEAVSIESHYTDTILCEAFGDLQTQQIDIYAVNADDWSSLVDTEVKLSNTGKTGYESVISKSETFLDSKYTIKINDGSPTEDPSVDENAMRTLCQDILVGTLILPEQIADFGIEQNENSMTVTFRASESFAQMIRSAACLKLYGDADVIDTQAQDYVTNTASCYLTLDLPTGLPLASGFRFIGTYTIDALPYRLEYSADQQYRLTDDKASSVIHREN